MNDYKEEVLVGGPCTRVDSKSDCMASEICPWCDNPPIRLLLKENKEIRIYDCYD
ncbi:MAG: hypothetical protein ACFFCQ_08540 [Promethearchaeota archaeon]